MTSRYTFVWWGDGYMVYDGEEYIGKDDQINMITDIIVRDGLGVEVDAEGLDDELNAYWGVPLTELLEAIGKARSDDQAD